MKQARVIESTVMYQGRAFDVIEESVELMNGVVSRHITARHPGAVVIIPEVSPGHLLLVRQYRHSVGKYLLEFPAGTLGAGEEPSLCASRELAEETGHDAKEWVDLGIVHPAPGFCSEIQYCYLARNLFSHTLPADEDEIIETVTLSVGEIERAIHTGEMTDGKSLALFAKARIRGLL